jgi:hypothetical protein
MKKKWFKLLPSILVLILSLAVSVAWAVEKDDSKGGDKATAKSDIKLDKCYEIKAGKENRMCRLFQENLNHFCKKSPMVCEPPIHPAFAKYFSVPKWEIVDYKSHLDVVEQYIKIRAIIPINCSGRCVAETREKKWQEYKPELLKRLESGKIKLARARIQIKYDDKPRIAYKLADTVCSPDDPKNYEISRKPGLMIVDEDTSKPTDYYTTGFNKLLYNDIIIYQDYAYLIDLSYLYYFPALYHRTGIECHYEYKNSK